MVKFLPIYKKTLVHCFKKKTKQNKTENERIIKKATDISLDNRILSGGLVLLMDLFYCYSKNKSISKMTLPLHTRDPLQFCTFMIYIESIFFILNISKS